MLVWFANILWQPRWSKPASCQSMPRPPNSVAIMMFACRAPESLRKRKITKSATGVALWPLLIPSRWHTEKKGPENEEIQHILSFVGWHYLNVRLGGRDYLEKQAVLSICAWVKTYGAKFGWMNIHKSQLFCSAWLKGLQKKNTSSLGFPATKNIPLEQTHSLPFITIHHD